MQYVVIGFLCFSIVLYFLLGGADFGAGIIELFTSGKNRKNTRSILQKAISPIWEANHMWVIIAIVILFVGFPDIYKVMSIYLHIPLLLMLVGIIARGTAFVFRSYDAVHDQMDVLYSRIFVYSSAITPFFLGIIAGSLISGSIDLHAGDYLSAYIFSWLSWFNISVGIFTVALSGFLAAVYLVGETTDPATRQRFIWKTRSMNIATVSSGALVFLAAGIEKVPLASWIFGNVPGVIAVTLAALSLILLWKLIHKGFTMIIRILAAFQVTAILFCVGYHHFPFLIITKDGSGLSLLEPGIYSKTMDALGAALLSGSVIILPALAYLLYSFEHRHKMQ